MAKRRGQGTLVCRACGAPVHVDAPACRHCGAVVVHAPPLGADGPGARLTYCARCTTSYPSHAGRCPRCPPATDEVRGGTCPRCTGTLEPVPMGRITADRCNACRGTWFDGNELEHVVDTTTHGLPSTEAVRVRRDLPAWGRPPETVRYLPCVRCHEIMTRRQVASRSGIIVDICAPHGLWFDADELEHFRAWCAAGGLEVLRYEGIAAVEARAAKAQRDRRLEPIPENSLWGPDGADVLFGLGSLLSRLF